MLVTTKIGLVTIRLSQIKQCALTSFYFPPYILMYLNTLDIGDNDTFFAQRKTCEIKKEHEKKNTGTLLYE